MTAITPSDTPPDLVDLIFDYIVAEFPEIAECSARLDQMRAAVRSEFAGTETYVPKRSASERQQLAGEVLRLFNGRNASEVARRLRISRPTVYRYIKTAGRQP